MLQWLQSPIVPMMFPYLHFLTIKSTTNSILATIPFVLYCVIIPTLRGQSNTAAGPVALALFLGIPLRMMDAASLGPKIIQKLTFDQYIRYMVAFERPSQGGKEPQSGAEKLSVPYEQQNHEYFKKLVPGFVLKFAVYYVIIKYMRLHRSEWNPKPMEMIDHQNPWFFLDIFMLGLALSLIMDFSIMFAFHLLSFICKTPYVPVMNQPYLATSIRDFWANRWNLIVQRGLRRSVFDPVLLLFGHSKDSKIPKLHLAVAGLVTFMVSSLVHEWTLLILLDHPTTYEQMSFFILHGFITTGEVAFQHLLRALGLDLKKIPTILKIMYAQTVLVLTGGLFLNPFIRDKTYFRIGFA